MTSDCAATLLRAANGKNEVKETHETLATYLGSAREAVTRALDAMAAARVLELSRGCLRGLDFK